MPDIDPTELSSQLLGNHIEFADRFVYSSYFVPLPMRLGDGGPPALTVQQKKNLKTYYRIAPDLVRSALEKLGFEEIVKDAGDYLPGPVTTQEQIPQDVARELEVLANQMRTQLHDVEVLAAPETEAAAGVASRLVSGKLAELGSAAEQITAQARRLESVHYAMASSGAPTRGPSRDPASEPELTEAEKLDLILNLIKSEIGWLFLDRTRIRPNGYAVGEHVHTMSLAPGEELVMEQKAFTKRQATYEEQNEQERQFDIELSSTFSTELQEGLDQQTNQNSTGAQGLAGMTGIDAKVNLFDIASFEKFKVTDASNETKRRSVKDSQTTTAKLSSKYRGLHKITFKVTTETGFETSAKRTIRNPNKYTPMQLHYFKMLQKLELSQERYGARLCWTPCLQDPGREVWKRLRDGRAAILAAAEGGLALPESPATPNVAAKPPTSADATRGVDKWNPDGGTDTIVTIPITVPVGYVWDGVLSSVRVTVDTLIKPERIDTLRVVSAAAFGQQLRVMAQIIVTPRKDWLAGNEWSSVSIVATARFIADPGAGNAEYQRAVQEWQGLMRAWEKQVADLKSQARASAVLAADAWEADALRQVNPLAEMMGRFIADNFQPPAVRDECWEIDLWQRMFDWGSATFKTYPGWWTGPVLRDPSKDPGHLLNASWARLYIPVNVGYEALALRWIYATTVAAPGSPELEKLIKQIVDDLAAFRSGAFGVEETTVDIDADCPEVTEKYLCMGHWYENMPTDGTHLEVSLSGSSAADANSLRDLEDTDKIRKGNLESQQADNELKERIGEKIDQPVQVKIVLPGDNAAEA